MPRLRASGKPLLLEVWRAQPRVQVARERCIVELRTIDAATPESSMKAGRASR